MSQSAFVTGGTGFVGGHLIAQLVELGWSVTALARESSETKDLDQLPVTVAHGDVTDIESLNAAIPRQVDAVFHVAASTNIWSRHNELQTRINVDGTRNVIEAARRAGAGRLVHTSSFVVWGFHDETITENSSWLDGAEWINYVRTKRIAEKSVKQASELGQMDAVICNPGHILGPGDRHNWSRMIRLVNAGKLPGVPSGGGAFADVREVAKAHIQAFHQGRSGENYLLGGEDASFLEVIQKVGAIVDKPVPEKASPIWQLRLAAQAMSLVARFTGKQPDVTPEGAAMIVRHIHCDSSKAQRELGYALTPVQQLLEETCQWMKAEGMLT